MSKKYSYDKNVSYSSETGQVGFHVRDENGKVVGTSGHPDTTRRDAEMRNYRNGDGQHADHSGK